MSSGEQGLRIAVLVKQVPDLQAMTVDPETRHARMPSEPVMNTYDVYGVGTAIDLKEQYGGTVLAIAAGPSSVKEVLLRAMATGADEAVAIDLPPGTELDSLELARILADQIREREIDVVLAGQSSEDIETGQVGLQVAELLCWPHVSLVTQVAMEDDELRVTRDAENAKEVLGVGLPVVLMVLSGRDGTQRHPTLRGMMAARKKPIPVVSPDLNETSGRLSWTSPESVPRESSGIVLEGVAPTDAASELVDWLRERKLI